jgi:hypothetical protein
VLDSGSRGTVMHESAQRSEAVYVRRCVQAGGHAGKVQVCMIHTAGMQIQRLTNEICLGIKGNKPCWVVLVQEH